MTLDAGITLGVVGLTLVLLALEWLAPDLLLLVAVVALALAGVVDLETALSGFADPTLLALGALFVVAAGLRATGVLRKTAHLLFGRETGLRVVLARLTGATAVSSAFLNNTPIVAMGIPAVLSWARSRDVSPSTLLIPLSYASIFGGVCTLIGTSTNLVADGMLRSAGREGLGFFELAKVGVPLGIMGIAYLVFVAPRLLPSRAGPGSEEGVEGTLGSGIHLFRVPEGSLAVGRTVRDAELNTPELQLVRVIRESGEVRHVSPDLPIRGGDRLTFRGGSRAMEEAAGRLRLEPVTLPDQPALDGLEDLREAVVPEGSDLVSSRIGGLDFAERYGAVVIGVIRGGRQLDEIRDVVLRPGDTLLLVVRTGFDEAYGDSRDFHLIAGGAVEPQALEEAPVWAPTRAKAGLAILAGVVLVAALGIVHISLAATIGAVVMVASGYVSPAEARRSVDWSVLIVIGGAIGLGMALQESGAADLVANGLVAVGRPFGPRGVLAALLVGSTLLTLLVTNNAAVAVLFPVATSVAASEGLDARPFVIAVTVAASLAFATPIGYQTNLMVYGPGGYRFTDFVRAGLPLQVLVLVAAVLLIPLFWSF